MKLSSVESVLFLVDGQKDRQNGQADGRIDNSSQFGESAQLASPDPMLTSYVKTRQ